MTNDQEYLLNNRDKFNEELLEFIAIPSIAALPEHAKDVYKAANWLKSKLSAVGVENVEIMDTGGQPAVYGDWLHAGIEKPTVLIYGHFDVQPVDPLELWDNDPFEPTIKDGKIFARGASDDKGSMFIPIIVFEAIYKSNGSFPFNIKFLFEGEEEIASPKMPEFVSNNVEKLKCDMIFSADGGQFSENEPNLAVGFK
ncbi:MAG: M20/M25/M40 family metallo-hydrolase, partial [Pseudomonadota bacterium]|nr:M20/M25/M40 family metallo-hydrolase [Pseudomonadota bacterium]